jgi:hypothetical protein
MPPRHTYWTIIAGGLPTAFRAARREELLPTFARIRERHPDAEMKWFAYGKLWESPEQAREARSRTRGKRVPPGEVRGRDWRPGGEHRDPRQKYKDAKKQRNLRGRARKFARKQAAAKQPREARGPEARLPRESGSRPFQRREFARGQHEAGSSPPGVVDRERHQRESESPAVGPPPRPGKTPVGPSGRERDRKGARRLERP